MPRAKHLELPPPAVAAAEKALSCADTTEIMSKPAVKARLSTAKLKLAVSPMSSTAKLKLAAEPKSFTANPKLAVDLRPCNAKLTPAVDPNFSTTAVPAAEPSTLPKKKEETKNDARRPGQCHKRRVSLSPPPRSPPPPQPCATAPVGPARRPPTRFGGQSSGGSV